MSSWIDERSPVFFDTDCLACFLWTSSLIVLHRLLPARRSQECARVAMAFDENERGRARPRDCEHEGRRARIPAAPGA